MNWKYGHKINAYPWLGRPKWLFLHIRKFNLSKNLIYSVFFYFREITFENAEELTEEGLPFLILFHAPDDTESIKNYKSIVEAQLLSEKREKHIYNLLFRFKAYFHVGKFFRAEFFQRSVQKISPRCKHGFTHNFNKLNPNSNNNFNKKIPHFFRRKHQLFDRWW